MTQDLVVNIKSIDIDNNQGKKTEKAAIKLLLDCNEGFIHPTNNQKKLIVQAFAMNDKIVYGKAFDLIKVDTSIDLNNLSDIKKKIKKIKLYELKSTNNSRVQVDFSRYFFGLTTAELLVAQNIKENYKFIFVNLKTQSKLEMTLNEVLGKAKGIYPTWSIQF